MFPAVGFQNNRTFAIANTFFNLSGALLDTATRGVQYGARLPGISSALGAITTLGQRFTKAASPVLMNVKKCVKAVATRDALVIGALAAVAGSVLGGTVSIGSTLFSGDTVYTISSCLFCGFMSVMQRQFQQETAWMKRFSVRVPLFAVAIYERNAPLLYLAGCVMASRGESFPLAVANFVTIGITSGSLGHVLGPLSLACITVDRNGPAWSERRKCVEQILSYLFFCELGFIANSFYGMRGVVAFSASVLGVAAAAPVVMKNIRRA